MQCINCARIYTLHNFTILQFYSENVQTDKMYT